MKLARKLIALNLALILSLSLLPLQALAASTNLSLGASVSFEEPNEDGYTFTPGSAGFYTVTISRTKYDSSASVTPASCGSLVVYQGTATDVAGITYKGLNWSVYTYTVPMEADKTYTIVPDGGGSYGNQFTCNYKLSVSKTDIPALNVGTSARFYVSNQAASYGENYRRYAPHYYAFTPSQSGWYTFELSSDNQTDYVGEVSIYDGTFEIKEYSSAFVGDGISSYFQSGQTYYLGFKPTEYSDVAGTYSIAVSQSSFPAITLSTNQSVITNDSLAYVMFTPETSGSYTITALDSGDGLNELSIYSSTGDWLDGTWEKNALSTLSVTMDLAGGSTYYIGVDGNSTISAVYGNKSATAIITALSPTNGATNVGYDASDPPVFKITFDREISSMDTPNGFALADLDFSKGSIKIFRDSDNALIYEVTYDSWMNDLYDITGNTSSDIKVQNGNTIILNPVNNHTLFNAGTKYYVTVDAGFIRFIDGTTNLAISSTDWSFSTAKSPVIPPTPVLEKDGEFKFLSEALGGDDKTITCKYHYDESWFFNSSYTYQHGLTQMSIRVALAAFGSYEKNNNKETFYKENNIQELLSGSDGLGFSNAIYEYPEPEYDSIGYAIGSKNIKATSGEECTLILVAVRGAGYGVEWGGNMRIGSDSTHDGFAVAAAQVKNGIKKFVEENKKTMCSNIKIWIVGYSRAAAVSNLVAQSLDAGAMKEIDAENVFAFCFECPQTTTAPTWSSKYSNIVNVVNPIDFVTKVAMSDWGYSRYGTTYYIPSKESNRNYKALKDKMLEIYTAIIADSYDEYPEIMASVSASEKSGQASILDDFMNNLAEEFVSQIDYFYNHQDNMVEIAATTLGGSGGIGIHNAGSFITEIIDLGSLAWSHPFNTASTIALFTKGYAPQAHYPELCLAWIDSLNGNYANESYRKVFINCPVDITVYDSKNQVVAKITNDIVEELENGIVSYIDDDEQKILVLPTDDEYRIEASATDDGTVTYTATEYNMDTSSTEKVVSYYQIDVVANDELTGIVENLDKVDSAVYPLYLNNNIESLTPSAAQSGDAVEQYVVAVSSSGNGSACGSGRHVSGEYSRVVATPDNGEKFLGWYINDFLVSSDVEYRFLVNGDINITAKFTEHTSTDPEGGSSSGNTPPVYNPTYDSDWWYPSTPSTPSYNVGNNSGSTANGSWSTDKSTAKKGDIVTITVKPTEGQQGVPTVKDKNNNSVTVNSLGDNKFSFTMPDGAVTISVNFFSVIDSFVDVAEGQYYYDAVLWAAKRGITNGSGSTATFGPDSPCTRAQIATFLWRAHGSPAPKGKSNGFTDVSSGQYYTDAVQWAVENGITNGTNDAGTTFGPGMICTRAQIATFLWQAAGSPEPVGLATPFTDVRSDAYYYKAVQWAVENGITNGTNEAGTTFSPDMDCSRAHIVTFLYRAYAK